MNEITDPALTLFSVTKLFAVLRATILISVGFGLAWLGKRLAAKVLHKKLSEGQITLIKRIVFYAILLLFCVSALRELGFKLSVLVGAAGIVSVAVGFASQTSASNFISGIFLMAERPFKTGDVIKVGDTTGEVLSIDWLSVKLRTFDNLYVRIPNETLIKSQTINNTRFSIRRFDLQISIAYKESIEKARTVLMEVADKNPLCLDEPAPLFIFLGFGESSLNIQFSFWGQREKFLDLRNTMYIEIKAAFDEAEIEIPFPHRTIYVGSATDPFPVQWVQPNGPPKPSNSV